MSTAAISEKRGKTRSRIVGAFLEIPLTVPKGTVLKADIIEISETGLSFKLPQSMGSFLPGTPLRDIIVYRTGQEDKKINAEVIHVYEFTDEGKKFYRVGIIFKDKKDVTSGGKKRNYKFRGLRYDLGVNNDVKGKAYLQLGLRSVEGSLLNVSRFGAAFEISTVEELFRVSDHLKNFEIRINDEEVYKGECIITSIREAKAGYVIGVSFKESWVELEKIDGIRKGEVLKLELSKIIDEAKVNRVDDRFKAKIADLRFLLEDIRKKLDEEEARLKISDDSDLERRSLEEEYILKTTRDLFQPRWNQSLASLNQLYLELPNAQDEYHRAYYQKHLHPLLLTSPFVRRVYTKPLGYVGDFQTMIIIYENAFKGESLFAKLINRCTLEVSAAQANRNRVKYLRSEIEKAGTSAQGKEFRFTSIGSGPALEIQNFIRTSSMSQRSCITLIDFETEALEYCQRQIGKLKTSLKNEVKVRLLQFSIVDLVHELKRNRSGLIEEQDFLYCSGLFEYLTDSACTRLIEAFLKFLRPGGKFILGNYDPSNPIRAYMDLSMEWFLIYRNKQQMLNLVKDLDIKNSYCEAEPLGINNFLVIEK